MENVAISLEFAEYHLLLLSIFEVASMKER